MNTQRVLAVVAAVLIVCAVGLGTLEAHPRPLIELLATWDAGLPSRLQAFIVQWLGNWVWSGLATPLLQRPAWFSPACLALLAVGLALSVPGRKTTNRSHRRS